MAGTRNSGRKPKPTAVKRAAGNPGGRPLNDEEPQFTQEIPACPAHLGKIARDEWKRISKELMAVGVLTMADRVALAAYCQLYERWVTDEEELAEHRRKYNSTLIETRSGYSVHPLVRSIRQTLELIKGYLIEFGLTPSSRTRIKVPPKKPESGWDAFTPPKGPSRPGRLTGMQGGKS